MVIIFMTGGTGYIGRSLIAALIDRGHPVHALVRRGSEAKLPAAAVPVVGNALDASTFASAIPPAATVVHLVGTRPMRSRRDSGFGLRDSQIPAQESQRIPNPEPRIPSRYWPYALVPVYAILRRLPATRETAERLGLVTHDAMVASLVNAVETPPPTGMRIVEVPEIRQFGLTASRNEPRLIERA